MEKKDIQIGAAIHQRFGDRNDSMDAGNVEIYDGSDISEACADQIHVREHYAEVDDYFVYLKGGIGAWDEGRLYRIHKSTGVKKPLVKLKNITDTGGEGVVKGICGYGQMIYLLMISDDSYGGIFGMIDERDLNVRIYQIDVETGDAILFYEKTQTLEGSITGSIQCSKQLIAYELKGYDIIGLKGSVLEVIDVASRNKLRTFNSHQRRQYQVAGAHLYLGEDSELAHYNYQTDSVEMLCELEDGFFEQYDTDTQVKIVRAANGTYLLQVNWDMDKQLFYFDLEKGNR